MLSKAMSQILGNPNRHFRVTFTKRTTGETRVLTGKMATLNPEGTPRYNPDDHQLLLVWDLEKNGYRTIPVEGIKKIELF